MATSFFPLPLPPIQRSVCANKYNNKHHSTTLFSSFCHSSLSTASVSTYPFPAFVHPHGQGLHLCASHSASATTDTRDHGEFGRRVQANVTHQSSASAGPAAARPVDRAFPGSDGTFPDPGCVSGRATAGGGPRSSCRSCGKTFAHSVSMLRHRRKCEGTPHLTCNVCGRQFHRRDSYSDHLSMAHGLVDDKTKRSFKG